jgi:hypothetical protein
MRTEREETRQINRRQPGDKWLRVKWQKSELYVGTWNVLSLHTAGALNLLLEQLEKYKIAITAIQEICWKGNGLLEKRGHTIFYSCDGKVHQFRTGFIVKNLCKYLVTDFKPVNPRISTLRIK